MSEKITDESISIAMITLNEEGAVAKVVKDISNLYPHAEVVIVDSSTDRTAEIACRAWLQGSQTISTSGLCWPCIKPL